MAAKAAADAVRSRGQEWTERTPDIERTHGEFLVATQLETRFGAGLMELETELTMLLDEHDALSGVCSHVRRAGCPPTRTRSRPRSATFAKSGRTST